MDEIVVHRIATLDPEWLAPLKVPPDFLPQTRRANPAHWAELFTYGDASLDGHMLEPAGIVYEPLACEYSGVRACKTCDGSLQRGRAPEVSLVNGTWTGPVPPELQDLTPAEEICLGLARNNTTAFFLLRGPGDPKELDTRQRASKGHWVAWPQYTDRAYEAVHALPLPPTDLAKVLHVTLLGPGTHDHSVLKKYLEVSVRRLRVAFDWLKINNHLYAAVPWDTAAANRYSPDGDIPSELEQFVWTDASEDFGERDEYTASRPEPARPTETVRTTEGSPPRASMPLIETEGSPVLGAHHQPARPAPSAPVEPHLDRLQRLLDEADDDDGDSGDKTGHHHFNVGGVATDDEIEVVKTGMVEAGGGYEMAAQGQQEAINRVLKADPVPLGRSSSFASSYDYNLLPSTLVKLYPYGVGGFRAGRRVKVPNSATLDAPPLLKHIRSLLVSADRRFAQHQTFMFFAFDLHQRREIAQRKWVKVGQSAARADDIASITKDDLAALRDAVANGRSGTRSESLKRAELLLKHCQWVMGAVVGSEHSRLSSRNDIKALTTAFGAPSVWFTLSPSDQQSVLLLKLNRDPNVNLDHDGVHLRQPMTSLLARQRIVTKDPVANALFFKATMDGVLQILFGATRDGSYRGVFGRALAHYATIESGKRGYLHAHGLLWLHGQPSPADFKNRLADPAFERAVVEYVDRVFAQDFADGARNWIVEANAGAEAGDVVVDRTSVLHHLPPDPDPYGDAEAWWNGPMQDDRRAVGELTLVHKCGKTHCMLKGSCRYRYPKELVQATHVTEAGEVVARRRHDRVNGHNPLVANLTRSNSDVKLTFLAPAMLLSFIYYCTNDVSIKRTVELLDIAAQTHENRLSADVEMPAAAVAYYLLHGEDHFSSEVFAKVELHSALARLARFERASSDADGDTPMQDDNEDVVEAVTLTVDDGTGNVIETNQVDDYIYRHRDLEDVSFYVFASRFATTTAKAVKTSTNSCRQYTPLPDHPRHRTHVALERETAAVPVILGPSIPRRHHESAAVRNQYGRSILTLFKPWRTLDDLRLPGEDWAAAERRFIPADDVQPFIDNLQLLHSMKAEADKMRAEHESLGPRRGLERDGRNDRGSLEPEPGAVDNADPDTVASIVTRAAHKSILWLQGAMSIFRAFGRVPEASPAFDF
ncbi:hypothetical protein JCM8097_007282 [Rhodosporidiobolus ruineniae]